MSAKPLEGAGTASSCSGADMLERPRKSRTEYAGRRMAAAVKRMGDVSLSSSEWEVALRWATVWGMAMRTGPRCHHADAWAEHTETCGLDETDRAFSGG